MEDIQITTTGGGIHIEGFPDAIKLARVEGEKAYKLKDLALHRLDLHFAAQCLKSINEEAASDFMQDALWRCAIVHYVKCFGEGARKPLKAGAVYKDHPPEALDAQEHFWNLRNKHIAHDVSVFARCKSGPS